MQAQQSSTCAQNALASCARAPVQYRAARKVPAQPQQPRASKQLLLVTWQGAKALEAVQVILYLGMLAISLTCQFEQHSSVHKADRTILLYLTRDAVQESHCAGCCV